MSLLTVEDVNSIMVRYCQNTILHEINTSLIEIDEDYSDVIYDFVKVSRTENNDDTYTFTFEIVNASFTYTYYMKTTNGTYINADATSYDDASHTITYTTTYKDIIIVLYCTYLDPNTWNDIWRCYFYPIPLDLSEKNTLDNINKRRDITYCDMRDSVMGSATVQYRQGVFTFGSNYWYLGKLLKTDFKFNITDILKVGKINTVKLGTDSRYKPNGSLIENNTPTITVNYKNENIPVVWDSSLNDYTFDLDLTDVTDLKKIKFVVDVAGNDVINSTSTKVSLDTEFLKVSDISSFTAECGVNGTYIMELSSDLQLSSSILIEHNIKLIGEEHTVDLNGYSLILSEGNEFVFENIKFINGNPAIIQKKHSEIRIADSTFTNCISEAYNNLGSCIYCDIDDESLTNPTDFVGTITSTDFFNNQSAIFYGGQLIIDKCRYLNNDINYINKHNVAFLYQTDGDAIITNSIFDIEYVDETLCTNQENINYAQALFQVGITATVNGATATDLVQNDSFPFDSNASHIFAKYYYPQIEECVYTSPIPNREDKALCYCVTGKNKIFKQNVQVTRASSETENRNRKIHWYDMQSTIDKTVLNQVYNETATINVVLADSVHKAVEEPITFEIWRNNNLIKTETTYTDENGEISYIYPSEGYGKTTIHIKTRQTLQLEKTYILEDNVLFDENEYAIVKDANTPALQKLFDDTIFELSSNFDISFDAKTTGVSGYNEHRLYLTTQEARETSISQHSQPNPSIFAGYGINNNLEMGIRTTSSTSKYFVQNIKNKYFNFKVLKRDNNFTFIMNNKTTVTYNFPNLAQYNEFVFEIGMWTNGTFTFKNMKIVKVE